MITACGRRPPDSPAATSGTGCVASTALKSAPEYLPDGVHC